MEAPNIVLYKRGHNPRIDQLVDKTNEILDYLAPMTIINNARDIFREEGKGFDEFNFPLEDLERYAKLVVEKFEKAHQSMSDFVNGKEFTSQAIDDVVDEKRKKN